MARSKFPFLGGISGKIGPIVAFVRYDKQFVRIHTIPRDPKTTAQLAQRAKLTLVNKGLSPLNKVIKQNYPNNSGAYRSLVGKTIREFVVGEYPNLSIDYSKIQIAEGRLLLPEPVTAAFNPDSNQVSFNWDTQQTTTSKWCRADDMVHIVIFNAPTLTVFKSPGIVKRFAGMASVELPKGWDPPHTHCWIYLSSHDHEQNSNSLYVKI